MKIPLFPLDVVLFPGASLPLHIFEDRYREMIGECLEAKQDFGIVRAKREGLAIIGCMARIVRVLERYSDGRLDILCEGRDRFEIDRLDTGRRFLQAEVDTIADDGPASERSQREQCAALHFEMLQLLEEEEQQFPHLDLDYGISFALAACLPADHEFKQGLLTMRSDLERTLTLIAFYRAVLPKLHRGHQSAKASVRNGRVM